METNYSYYSTNLRLQKIQTGKSGSSYQDSSYSYDSVGNILSIRDVAMSYNRSYAYDNLDRLIVANNTTGYKHTYSYNPIGNLISFTSGGQSVSLSYGISAGPHALTSFNGTTLTYDSNGNLVQDSQFYYEYNDVHQLRRVRKGSPSE